MSCSSDRGIACGNCQDPTFKYKCDKTDPKNPKCNKCTSSGDAGCQTHDAACLSCVKQEDKFSCNNKTLKCEKSKDS